ncbi:unnamed protein product [Gongylonema pulchrum]|uniref:Secreted protein n=1 Tax=Gongylonema pulchrum TaxID=637853 RepID=A0A183DXU7_9BILA|nr:unnamed protein product [Gongylonema pulchrum]
MLTASAGLLQWSGLRSLRACFGGPFAGAVSSAICKVAGLFRWIGQSLAVASVMATGLVQENVHVPLAHFPSIATLSCRRRAL